MGGLGLWGTGCKMVREVWGWDRILDGIRGSGLGRILDGMGGLGWGWMLDGTGGSGLMDDVR